MSNERILIVDDEKTILELSRRFLSGEGYQVEVASSGMEALQVMEKTPFPVLLTDIRMPGMSGLELMKLIRSAHPEVVVIVITGHGTITTAIESLKMGAMGFILKPFTHQELTSVVLHATQKMRLAKENMRMHSLMPLLELNRSLLSNTDIGTLLQTVVKTAREQTHADRVSLSLYDAAGTKLSMEAAEGFSPMNKEAIEKMGEGIVKRVLETGKPVAISTKNADAEWKKPLEEQGITTVLSLPLVHRKKVIGVTSLYKVSEAPEFSESDQELAALLGGQAAVAIENARLYGAIQRNHILILQALVAAIEIKDLFSRGHSTMVAKYAAILARKLGLSRSEIHDLILASILHDIGKLGNRDEILSKPEGLSPEEFAEMKGHPDKALKIVEPIELKEPILSAIRHHHEAWDGSGYPNGLSKEEIPLFARLIAIADALDTMLSDRPFRKKISFADARKEIAACKGGKFDPKIVEAFEAADESLFLDPFTPSDFLFK